MGRTRRSVGARLLLGASIVLVGVMALIGAGVIALYHNVHRNESERRAYEVAYQRAKEVSTSLRSAGPAANEVELRLLVAATDGAELLTTTGTDRQRTPGVDVLFRVRYTHRNSTLGVDFRTRAEICLRQRLDDQARDYRRREVVCPEHAPPTPTTPPQDMPAASPDGTPVAPPPTPPAPRLPADTGARLRAALTPLATAPTLGDDDVRAAVDGLRLDPRIVRRVGVEAGVAGVGLRTEQRCVMARVRTGQVEVWELARVQLQPGELSCGADEAIRGLGMNAPK